MACFQALRCSTNLRENRSVPKVYCLFLGESLVRCWKGASERTVLSFQGTQELKPRNDKIAGLIPPHPNYTSRDGMRRLPLSDESDPLSGNQCELGPNAGSMLGDVNGDSCVVRLK